MYKKLIYLEQSQVQYIIAALEDYSWMLADYEEGDYAEVETEARRKVREAISYLRYRLKKDGDEMQEFLDDNRALFDALYEKGD